MRSLRIAKKDELIEILKLISPGKPIREGLNNILKARTGALLVFSDSKEVLDIVDGGFFINEDYSASKLYELAKMDGAIVLSTDLKKILYANAQLIPSPDISTKETGTRHRTAERVAKQTGELVVSISQRRNVITIFKGNLRYTIQDATIVLNRTNQALQTLEKYKKVFDNKLNVLNEYEFNDIVTLDNVIDVIQRAEMVMKIKEEVERGIFELGEDGRLINMQLEELIGDLDKEELYIIKDYKKVEKEEEDILQEIIALPHDELLKQSAISKILGYEITEGAEEVPVYSVGYRILTKVPKIPNNIIENLVKDFGTFKNVLSADIPTLDDVEGIGEVRARSIKQSLKRMQEQLVFDNALL